MSPGNGEGWWDEYFDRAFVELYRPLLPTAETEDEVAGVVEALGLRRGSRVLDLACGWGRHAVPLAGLGYRVAALDRSAALLAEGARAAKEANVRVAWVRADMREIPFVRAFDAVVSLFSSLGYFLSDEEDLRVLRGIRSALKPKGTLLLETMHRDQVAREYVERDWWEGPDGERVWVEREFDAVAGVSREWLRWRRGAAEGEKFHQIRIRSASEWEVLLRAAGLEPVAFYGDWDLSDFCHRSDRLIVLSVPG